MVQIEGYLKEVEHLLLYSSELSLKTTKRLLRLFEQHLSSNERARNRQNIDRVLIISTQQLSLEQQQLLDFLDRFIREGWKSIKIQRDYKISKDDLTKLEQIRGMLK